MAHLMTLSDFKTCKSLTCEVIGLMGLHWLAETREKKRHFSARAEEGMCGWRRIIEVFKEMDSSDELKHHQMCLENTGLANWINRW